MKEQKLSLMPKDYIVVAHGLKIQNTTEDMVYEFIMPKSILMIPVVNEISN